MSYLTHLECGYCGSTFNAETLHTVCPKCGKPLLARYDLESVKKSLGRDDLIERVASLWRYRELLPVREDANIVSLGEGYTPLIHAARSGARLGMERLFIKDEGLNPTGSFKACGLCMAISRAKELGVTEVVIPSAGNAAGAMSAYAARAGMKAHVFMPSDVPLPFRLECAAYGADVHLIDGLITDCGREAHAQAEKNRW
ncbi:MAG TPA: pyridoxal-phosphate dependent enzyme, partial [Candidatus Acetothermia bacterium]|nr:pyridoxal-phosphate dependent enzyme [Candidatus Acetothermia bacterium]